MSENIDKFDDFLRKRKYSAKTVVTYLGWLQDLEKFYSYKNINSLTQKEVEEYIDHLKRKRRIAPTSIKQAFYAIKHFYELMNTNAISFDGILPAWKPQKPPIIPTQTELFNLFNNIQNHVHKIALSTIYATGSKLNEIVDLCVKDIDSKNNKIIIRDKDKNKIRRAILPEKLKKDLISLQYGKKNSDYLFTNSVGKQYSASSLQKAFSAARKKAEIDSKITIHSLRHAYIRHMELLGVPLVVVLDEIGLSKERSLFFYGRIAYPNQSVEFSPIDANLVTEDRPPANKTTPYVSNDRINQLSEIKSKDFDLIRLTQILRELNSAHMSNCYMSISMLVRAILDHIPPIFGCNTFNEVSNNLSGGKSFKKAMIHLNNSLRNIADSYLHITIRNKESLPTFNQVDFRSDIDLLLAEIIRILKV